MVEKLLLKASERGWPIAVGGLCAVAPSLLLSTTGAIVAPAALTSERPCHTHGIRPCTDISPLGWPLVDEWRQQSVQGAEGTLDKLVQPFGMGEL